MSAVRPPTSDSGVRGTYFNAGPCGQVRGLKSDKSGAESLAEARGYLQALPETSDIPHGALWALGPMHAPARGLSVFVNQKPILEMLAAGNQVAAEGNSRWGVPTAHTDAAERTERAVELCTPVDTAGPGWPTGSARLVRTTADFTGLLLE